MRGEGGFLGGGGVCRGWGGSWCIFRCILVFLFEIKSVHKANFSYQDSRLPLTSSFNLCLIWVSIVHSSDGKSFPIGVAFVEGVLKVLTNVIRVIKNILKFYQIFLELLDFRECFLRGFIREILNYVCLIVLKCCKLFYGDFLAMNQKIIANTITYGKMNLSPKIIILFNPFSQRKLTKF